jgi:hypothetical protein
MSRFLPVIHCTYNANHALYNARIAYENGADGIFLINHNIHYSVVCFLYEEIRKKFPQSWIGINLLDVANKWKDLESILCVRGNFPGLNALWVDGMPNHRLNIKPEIEVFGGVAFKYLNPNQGGNDLALACEKATKNVNVITTSGNQTGSPPSIEKLMEIRKHIGNSRLALASGVTLENITSFKPIVDDFIVASSIIEMTAGNEYFVPNKVKQLAMIIKKEKL